MSHKTNSRKSKQPLPPLDVKQRHTIEEAGAYLRTSRASVYNLINSGLLKVIKEGKRTYVPGSEIARRSALPQ